MQGSKVPRGYRTMLLIFTVALLLSAHAFAGGKANGVYLRTVTGQLVAVCRPAGRADAIDCACAESKSDAELERCLGLAPRSLATTPENEPVRIELRFTVPNEAPAEPPSAAR